MKIELYVLIALQLAHTCNNVFAMDNNNAFRRIDQSELDENVMQLLNDRALYFQPFYAYERLMQQYSENMNLGFDRQSIDMVHKVFVASRKFNQPCNADSLVSLRDGTRHMLTLQNENNLKLILGYLLQDKSAEKYAHRCINEFDVIARQCFDGNCFEAKDLISKLVGNLSEVTRFRMMLAHIERDTSYTSITNAALIQDIDSTNYLSLCNTVNDNPEVTRMLNLFSIILGPMGDLRPRSVAMRLNQQTQSPDMNSIKMLTLAVFCKSYIIERRTPSSVLHSSQA